MTAPVQKNKKSSRWFYLLVLTMLVMFGTLNAQNTVPPKPINQMASISVPHCDEAKIRLLADTALVNLVHNSGTAYTITLNTAIMTFTDLTKKMQKAGCF